MKISIFIVMAGIVFLSVSDSIKAEKQTNIQTINSFYQKTSTLESAIQKAVLIDRTISQVGHRFFKAFSQQWELPENVMNRIVTVYEQPTAQGSMIWIHWNYKRVFQGRLLFREDVDKKAALASLIVNAEIKQAQDSGYSTNEDLAADEF